MTLSAEQWGIAHNSCSSAMVQRRALGPDKTQADWWLACERGDWLIWQLQRLPREQLHAVLLALLRAVDRITYRAVENTAAAQSLLAKTGDEVPEVLAWAQGWVSGQDRSESAAESAAWSAESAAWSAELKQQADDIRAEIPSWPGEE